MRAEKSEKPERPEKLQRPDGVDGDIPIEWGSDALAELLSRLDLRYLALVPGSSYRGLHDSLVNYTGNRDPRMLVCLHEEHAVAIAHGYAKVTGRPMAVALHSNVGLMHATMAIYNAWCDRVPMLIVGATGPVDAARRRPWIDWIHTSADQGALIRPYVKWDDQPASVEAALDSLAQAYSITRAAPSAPVYVCLDVSLQEQRLSAPPAIPDVRRDRSPRSHGPDAEAVRTTLDFLGQARRPLFLFGRLSRDERDWDRRVALAERYGALVLSDLKNGAVFPTAHPLHPDPPGIFLPAASAGLIGGADLILSLDWTDLAGTLSAAASHGHPAAGRIISCTSDSALRNGWSKDSFGRDPVDLSIPADPDLLVRALLVPGEPFDPFKPVKPAEWPVRDATPPPPVPRRRRRDRHARPGRSAPRRTGRLARLPGAAPARLARRRPAGRSPAGLPGDGRRRGHRLRAGHGRRRCPRPRGQRAARGGRPGRRRLPDGRDRGVDRGALPAAAADRGGEQLLLPQRRGPRRAHGQPAPSASQEHPDRPGHFRSRSRPARLRPLARFPRRGQVRDRSALPAALAAAVAAARYGKCAFVDVRISPDH